MTYFKRMLLQAFICQIWHSPYLPLLKAGLSPSSSAPPTTKPPPAQPPAPSPFSLPQKTAHSQPICQQAPPGACPCLSRSLTTAPLFFMCLFSYHGTVTYTPLNHLATKQRLPLLAPATQGYLHFRPSAHYQAATNTTARPLPNHSARPPRTFLLLHFYQLPLPTIYSAKCGLLAFAPA